MPARKVNWDAVEVGPDYSPVPEGRYAVEITSVIDTDKTRKGDEMWRVDMTITEGEYQGRSIRDIFVFSEKAIARLKLFYATLGMNTEGEGYLEPKMLIGRRLRIDVIVQTIPDSSRVRNAIPWAGFSTLDNVDDLLGGEETTDADNKGLPFWFRCLDLSKEDQHEML